MGVSEVGVCGFCGSGERRVFLGVVCSLVVMVVFGDGSGIYGVMVGDEMVMI